MIKSITITKIDFSKVNTDNLEELLNLLGFTRYVENLWIDPKRSIDPRLGKPDESPEGLYTGIIVPEYHFGKTLFLIDKEVLQEILSALKKKEEV